MSHNTTIDTQVKDIETLRSACAELGLPIEGNAEARGYRNNRLHGDFVIRLNGPYDVAVRREPTGEFSLHAEPPFLSPYEPPDLRREAVAAILLPTAS